VQNFYVQRNNGANRISKEVLNGLGKHDQTYLNADIIKLKKCRTKSKFTTGISSSEVMYEELSSLNIHRVRDVALTLWTYTTVPEELDSHFGRLSRLKLFVVFVSPS
jgi:hypothetical protein